VVDDDGNASVLGLVEKLPEGYSEVRYRGARWAVTRTRLQDGKVQKLWAEELGGTGVVSANLYLVTAGEQFRPCEMPASVVLDFLRHWEPSAPAAGSGSAAGGA
jgi:peptide-methionine (S)-S-oxide reductase